MGAKYVVTKIGTALVVNSDSLTITAPATRALKISEIRVYGQAVASAANEIQIMRTTGGATPVAITPQPRAVGSAAALFTAAGSWTTQPTAGVVIGRIGVNSHGAYTPYTPMPGSEIEIPPSGQLSFRSAVGTGSVTLEVVVEEVG